MVKKFEDMFSRLDRILACDRRTDGHIDILPQQSPRYAYTSCGNKFWSNQELVYNFRAEIYGTGSRSKVVY